MPMNPEGAARRDGHDTRDALHSGTSAHTCFACNSPLTPKRFQEVEAKRAELIEHVRATMILERDAEIDKIRVEAAAQVAKAKTDVAERESAIRKQAVAATTAALRERIAQAEQAKKVAEQQAKKLKADHEKLTSVVKASGTTPQ